MRHEIVMPRLSDAVEEGVLVTWFVEPGAAVREGDLVAEVQVEKVAAEVRAPADGRIGGLLAEPGGIVRQDAPIAVLETDVPAPGATAAVPDAETVRVGAPAAAIVAPTAPPASPAARRLARELGVDLAALAGSGPGGRIIEADIRAAARAPGPAVAAETRPDASPAPGAVPLSPMRRTIADRLRTGLASTAQLTLTAEADLTALAGRLATWSAAWDRRATYTEATVRACALALREHPGLAARLTPEGLVQPDRIDIGVAVAIEDGLLVPVVRDADRRSLAEVGAEIDALAERARAGRLEAREMEGACFSVTNLGAHRIDAFTPLLDPPQTAILGVGRARPRPAVVDGAIAVRTIAVLSLTFDHQVVDGAPAAAFLDAVVGLLEEPDRLGG